MSKWTSQEMRRFIDAEFTPVVTNYRADFVCDAINAEFRTTYHEHEDEHAGAITSALFLLVCVIGTIITGFAIVSAVIGAVGG
jgi:hypothetical protein